jgi:predicted permease
MESLLQDIKFGAKLLWKDKGFAATAIATLALCIGANAAIFSVINSVILQPLPVPESDRLLIGYNSYPNAGVQRASNGVPDYYDRLRELDDVLEEQAMLNNSGLTIGEAGSVQRAFGINVTPSYFRLLRAEPLVGRIFTEAEGEPGNEQKVVLSYALWQQLYGGDETALGRDLRIYGRPYTIVGVMPEDFAGLRTDADLWRPLAFTEEQKSDQNRHSNSWEYIARLRPGATLEQVRAQMDALTAANFERFPEWQEILSNAGYHVQVHNLQEYLIRDIRPTLYILWGGVLFVLMIGAVNIANLVLARSSVRMKELATRFSLGAGRWRVSRQLLTESVLLTLFGGAFGVLLGYWGLSALRSVGLDEMPRGGEVSMDGTVLGFILALALLVGIFISLIPMYHVLRANMSSVFREEGRTGTSGRGSRLLRNSLVVVQVGIAFVNLIGAGLLLASFQQVLAIDPGFRDPEQVLTGGVALPSARYEDGTAIRAFMNEALERIRSLPGVVAAGATGTIPFGGNNSDSVILAEGYEMEPGESLVSPSRVEVSPGYFEAMGVDLLAGRYFDRTDTQESQPVVMVDERLAQKFWPDQNPVGKRMYQPTNIEDVTAITEDTVFLTVVGVVRSMKLRALVDPDERVGIYFFPLEQRPRSGTAFAIKTAGDPNGLIGAIRAEITDMDPEMPFIDPRTMQVRMDDALVSHRSPMVLATVFGGVALFLAAVGIYGVLAYMVAQRTKEIGIRVALGSGSNRIFKLILKEGVTILAIGFGLGLVGTYGLSRVVGSLLYEVEPLDPIVLISVIVLLGAVALFACLVPARRASRVDPIVALRQE